MEHFSNGAILKWSNSQIEHFSNGAILKWSNSQIEHFSKSAIWGRHHQLDDSLVGQLINKMDNLFKIGDQNNPNPRKIKTMGNLAGINYLTNSTSDFEPLLPEMYSIPICQVPP